MYCYDGDHCSAEWPIFRQSFGSAYFGVQKNTRLTQWLYGAPMISAPAQCSQLLWDICVHILCLVFSKLGAVHHGQTSLLGLCSRSFVVCFVAVMFFSERRSNLFSLFLKLLWWILTFNIQTEAYRVRDAGLGFFGSLSEHCTVWPWG